MFVVSTCTGGKRILLHAIRKNIEYDNITYKILSPIICNAYLYAGMSGIEPLKLAVGRILVKVLCDNISQIYCIV